MQQWKRRGNYHTVEEVLAARTGISPACLRAPERTAPEDIENLPALGDLLIQSTLKEGRPVVIVGDYDADGITSTAILSKLFRHLGIAARTVIPRRFSDGYGLSEGLVAGLQGGLIVTVDNGVSAVEAIAGAKAAGNRVLVLDHHLPQEALPPADVIVDPHLHPEKNGYTDYCGAGLAYKLAEYLCAGESPREKSGLFFDLLVLACLGTLADVMPLTGDNRRLVMDGLRVINRESWYRCLSPGLQAVLDLAPRPYDEDTVKFQIAPILNAAGRLYDAGSTSVLKALLCGDPAAAAGYAAKMRLINEKRKDLVTRWEAALLEDLQEDAPILLLRREGIPEGILGILAGKLAQRCRRPAFVFSGAAGQPGLWKGSGRSFGDYDLFPLLQAMAPHTAAWGGHAGAGGLSVAPNNFPALTAEALAFAAERPPEVPEDILYYDLPLAEADLPQALTDLRALAPYGEGVEKPVLMVPGYRLVPKGGQRSQRMGRQGEHLKLFGGATEAVGFGMAETYEALGRPQRVDLLGTVEENVFRGRSTLQFRFEALRPAEEEENAPSFPR